MLITPNMCTMYSSCLFPAYTFEKEGVITTEVEILEMDCEM